MHPANSLVTKRIKFGLSICDISLLSPRYCSHQFIVVWILVYQESLELTFVCSDSQYVV